MNCKDAQKLSSDYLDGELSPERSTLVRGHLRSCAQCEQLFEEEARYIEAAAQLGPLDPPDAVWEGIEARIAEAEVRESREPLLRRWIRRRWPVMATGAALSAAVAALLLLASPGDTGVNPQAKDPGSESAASAPEALQASFEDSRIQALTEADRSYIESIAELRELIEEDRLSWSEQQATAVDAQLAEFRRASIGGRLEIASAGPRVTTRDALYAGYRAEIAFLQNTLAGQLPEAQ